MDKTGIKIRTFFKVTFGHSAKNLSRDVSSPRIHGVPVHYAIVYASKCMTHRLWVFYNFHYVCIRVCYSSFGYSLDLQWVFCWTSIVGLVNVYFSRTHFRTDVTSS